MRAGRQLDTDQSLYICGIFEGDIAVPNTVLIGREGLVSANVTAEHVIVQGVIIGSVRAGRVEIHSSGQVWGNVCTQTFHVEPGGFVRGQIITPLQTEHVLNPLTLESSTATVVSLLRPPPDDALDHLLVELEAAAQRGAAEDNLLKSPQPLHIKEALARVAEAKNWTISQLQLELHAIQSTIAEQEALIATLSADMAHAGSEREMALVQQNAELRDELQRLRMIAPQRQQNLTRLQVELEETRLALQASQDEITYLSTDLATANARIQHLSDEIACSEARHDDLSAVTTEASEQLHSQLAEAERDRVTADLDAARGQIAQLTDQLAQAQTAATERGSLQTDLERLRDEQANAQVTVEQLTVDLNAARAEIEHLNSKHAAALSVVQTERDTVSAELEAARQRAEQLLAERDGIQANLERLRDEHASAQAGRVETRSAVEQLTAELEAARQRAEQLLAERDGLQADLERLRGEHVSAQADRVETRSAVEQLTAELNVVQAERDTVSAELEATRQRAEQLLAERDSLQTSLERLRDEHVNTQATVEQLTADLNATHAEIEHLNSEHAAEQGAAQINIERLTSDLDATRHRLEQTIAERDTFQAEWEKAQSAAAQLTADLEDTRRQITQLDNQLTEQEAEIARLQANLEINQDQIGQQQEYTAYCLPCRTHRPIKEVRELVMPDGRRVIKGYCAVCGANLIQQVPSD